MKILWEKVGGHLQHGSIHSQHVYVRLALKNKKILNVHWGYISLRPYLFAQHYLLAPLHPRPLVFSLEPHHLPKKRASKQTKVFVTSSSEKNPLTSANSGILSQLVNENVWKMFKLSFKPDAAEELFDLRLLLLCVGLCQHLQKQVKPKMSKLSSFCSLLPHHYIVSLLQEFLQTNLCHQFIPPFFWWCWNYNISFEILFMMFESFLNVKKRKE